MAKRAEPAASKKLDLFGALARLRGEAKPSKSYEYPIQAPALMPGVLPKEAKSLVAEDSLCAPAYQFSRSAYDAGACGFVGFPGYPYLAQLSTRPEYRNFASAMSTEITREWLTLQSTETAGDETKKKITELTKDIEECGLRDAISKMVEHDSFYGKAQLFLDLDGQDRELPLVLSPKTVKKGAKFRIAPVEPMWTTPSAYNAIDPAAKDFYKPTGWFMMGQKVHASRLLTVVTREVADMLKPAFNFGGMSMSQLAEPYVDNWIRTRQSVSDLISNFSIVTLATAMEQVLQGADDGSDLLKRAEFFTLTRNNKGVMLLDKDKEELAMFNVPISGLDALQAQSQEQQCSVSHIPAVVLLGVSPTGFGNVAEGEMTAFRQRVKGEQTSFWSKPAKIVIDILQLIRYGSIDPDIMISWESLSQMTPKELAEIRAANATTAAAYLDRGVIDATEERERLARDPNSGYQGIDTGKVPAVDSEDENETENPAMDEWNEGEHPRRDDGKFGTGNSSKLNSNEDYAINHYIEPSDSETGFRKLNAALRSGEENSSEQRKQIERLDSAIQKLPKFNGRTYRSLRFDSEENLQKFLKDHKEGRTVSYPEYLSTSKNTAGVKHSKVALIIEGTSGADLEGISKDIPEQEVLYPRNSRFEVTRIAEGKNGQIMIGLRESRKGEGN